MPADHRTTTTVERPLAPVKWPCTCGADGTGRESCKAHLAERDNDMDWIVATDGAPADDR